MFLVLGVIKMIHKYLISEMKMEMIHLNFLKGTAYCLIMRLRYKEQKYFRDRGAESNQV